VASTGDVLDADLDGASSATDAGAAERYERRVRTAVGERLAGTTSTAAWEDDRADSHHPRLRGEERHRRRSAVGDDRGDSEHERGREHERHTEDAVRDVRGVRVGDDDNANEPERDTECGGGGELLVGGDETRERGRHDGDETQQNGGDAARDVPLAGEEKRVMGSDNERTADEHVDIVVPSPGRKSAPEARAAANSSAAATSKRTAANGTAGRSARPTSVAMNAVPRPHTAARSGRLSGSDSFTRKSPTDCEICVEPHWLSERQGSISNTETPTRNYW